MKMPRKRIWGRTRVHIRDPETGIVHLCTIFEAADVAFLRADADKNNASMLPVVCSHHALFSRCIEPDEHPVTCLECNAIEVDVVWLGP